MKTLLILIVFGFMVTGFNGCGFSRKYLKTKTDNYTLNVEGKKRLKIDNINGNISISHSNDSGSVSLKTTREIKVKKKYLDAPFEEITVNIDTLDNYILLTTEIEKKGEDGIFNIDREQRVDFEIKVPHNLSIEVENRNGTISLTNLDNDVMLDITNGEVSVDNYTGLLECETINGDFTGHIDSTRGINISTVNGSVSLYLNSTISARLRAESVSSKITENNLSVKDAIRDKGMLKGKIGTGDDNVDIKIETVNGRIKLYGSRNDI